MEEEKNKTDIVNKNQLYEEEVDKLIEWLQHMPHLPNVTGKLLICISIFNGSYQHSEHVSTYLVFIHNSFLLQKYRYLIRILCIKKKFHFKTEFNVHVFD